MTSALVFFLITASTQSLTLATVASLGYVLLRLIVGELLLCRPRPPYAEVWRGQ